MKYIRTLPFLLPILLMLACALPPLVSHAQQAGAIQVVSPLTRDLGSVKTLTAQPQATVTSADQNGFNVSRVVCVFNQSTYTGSPSTTFKIQNKDTASGLYYDLITSSAVTTAVNTPSAISAGAGVVTTANVGAGIPIAQKWRVSLTEANTPVTITGTVGCSVQ